LLVVADVSQAAGSEEIAFHATVTHLEGIVAVIPSMAILQGLKLVSKSVVIRNRTLSNAIHSVHLIGVELPDAMPVYRSPVFLVQIGDVDDELITPARLEQRAGIGIVECLAAGLEEAICCDLEEVRSTS
jgi:hypothetical protein